MITVFPRGVKAELTYRVRADNTDACVTLSGYTLLSQGFPVSVPAALSSELLTYEAVE